MSTQPHQPPSLPPAGAPAPRPFARPRKRRRVPPPTVRPNPPHYTTDLSPTAQTAESRAATLLLSGATRSVTFHGLPGTGKTVALRAVAHHAPVVQHFCDGVVLLALTPTTTPQTLLESVAALVASVSPAAAPAPDPAQPPLVALSAAARHLSTRRVLLLLDDASDHGPPPPPLAPLVTRLVATVSAPGARAAVLAATRAADVARSLSPRAAVPLRPRPPTGPAARDILCAHAGFSRTEFDRLLQLPDSPAASVLHKCAGLPLALAVAGGAVKRLLASATTTRARDLIWQHYRAYLHGSFAQFGQISGLFKALGELCDAVRLRNSKWPAPGGVEGSVAALAVLKGGEWVSFRLLVGLWGVPLDSVIVMVGALAGRGLVLQTHHGAEYGVEVSPIVLDYCRYLAEKSPGLLQEKARLLRDVPGAKDVIVAEIDQPVQPPSGAAVQQGRANGAAARTTAPQTAAPKPLANGVAEPVPAGGGKQQSSEQK